MSVTINSTTQDIQITRGDSFSFTIKNKDTGLPYVFDITDKLTMTVKKSLSDTTPLFTKEFIPDIDGNIIINIEPTDTKTAVYGKYVYDIQWEKLSGWINTIIPVTGKTSVLPIFEICKEVTD